ncbi:hypothetical protein FQN60_015147 [Etheostoma spectabile]|uniref:Translin-associated factor X-interacting protein 1 N-terminal domain-containing protein n=1 Tax=Etheostoma spectabile TaxID=54343 RepID=A0A5J5CSL8_9PERO|nr:hypothetical protein FQN60_015147 [Etheostoma spectabile]
MFNSSKPKPGCYRSDIQRLLLAAEAGQKDDILTYSSGHLGPRCLNQSQPHRDTKQSFWSMSQSLKETPKPLKSQLTRTKALVYVKKKEMKVCPPKFSTGTALVKSEILKSRQDKASHCSSHADKREDGSLPKIVYCSSNSLPIQPRAFSQNKSKYLSDLEGKQQFVQEGQNNDGQLKKKQQFGRKVIAKQDLWAGIHVAEMHERKLQKELSRLSVHSWPSRDRLAVFSDVFDDVCEGSPVFGRILREIKLLDTSLKDLGNGKVRQMELEDAEKEVFRLEQEARRALEENKRVRNESQNVPAIIGPEDSDMKNPYVSGLQDSCTNNLQSKRLQVLNTWREIQQLEEEIKEKLVSSVTTTATAGRIKDLKDLENNINMVLDREKASKAIRRMLWDKIHCDLQTESNKLHQQVTRYGHSKVQ